MLGLFENKRNRFIGVDFGTSAIKIIELSVKDHKPYLENYGYFDLAGITQSNDLNQQKLLSYDDKFKMALSGLLKKMKLEGGHVNVAIPGFSGLVVLIEFPAMKDEEIEKAIEFEAHKYIPTSIEEVSISWDILKKPSKGENSEKKIEVLLVAAPKKEVQKFGAYFEGTGFKMDSVELETFSIARAIIGNEQGISLIMDMGSRATNLILVENGMVIVNRTVDAGGNDITTTIAESLNISKQRAESFKKEGKDFINERETAIVMPSLELLGNEARRIIASFKEKNKDAKINKLILSGGSSELFGIDKYFFNMLNIETVKGSPLKKIAYDPLVAPFIEKTGTSFSVAIGLALRGIEDNNSEKK